MKERVWLDVLKVRVEIYGYDGGSDSQMDWETNMQNAKL